MERKLPGIPAKKSLGQYFLNNAGVPKQMADAAGVNQSDTVLEIGPGTGMLTRELLSRGARVIASEADPRAIESLRGSFAEEIETGELTLVPGDVREIDLKALGLAPRAYKIVANIPYYLSGMLFRFFLEHAIQPRTLVFLVQKEVAERIARDPKESLLSLSVKVFGVPRYVKTIKKGNFTPQPNVDSAIVAISEISRERLEEIPPEFFFDLLHEGFKSKRKQLVGNLATRFGREILLAVFARLGIPADARGEDLSFATWLALSRELFRIR